MTFYMDMDKKQLIERALEARRKSYSPYSNYAVGAALLTKSGDVYLGANIENAAFGSTICAERTAIFQAVLDGHRDFERIIVATRDGGSPCGACRQVMAEFSLDMIVTMVNEAGEVTAEGTVLEFLPYAFTPKNIE